jgi:BirA family transcriptional regulator, biotin operon repressor / biotin---[acetyl-CoA-carboxylase] ligase
MTPDPNLLPDDLARGLAVAGARLGPFARRTLWYPEVGSTNDVAGAMAERGADEGLVVIADRQTAGRGRLGRVWASPPGVGLYMSIVLRPSTSLVSLLTIAAGVGVAEGIESATGLGVQLKWPNDVHVDGRKVAGILAEGAPHHVVLGIGVNVLPATHPRDVALRATSIETELGRAVDRGLLFAECLSALAARYRGLHKGEGSSIVEAWRRRAAESLGRAVEWDEGPARKTGLVDGIGEDGALRVKAGDAVVHIRSGEVRWQ